MAADEDFAQVAARIKKQTEDFKRQEAERMMKSKDANLRETGKNWKANLESGTATMLETRPGFGKRVDDSGKASGTELRKLAPGEWETGKPVKKAKGGSVSASSRADGCARRGKTKGRMI